MRRLLTLFLLFILLAAPLFAWDAGGWDSGKFSSGLIGMGYVNGNATDMPSGITAIPLNYGVIKKTIGSASDEAGTLANTIQGQVVKIVLVARNSSGNYVLTPTKKTGFATITFNSIGDQATLLFVDNTVGWIIVGETGTAVGQ